MKHMRHWSVIWLMQLIIIILKLTMQLLFFFFLGLNNASYIYLKNKRRKICVNSEELTRILPPNSVEKIRILSFHLVEHFLADLTNKKPKSDLRLAGCFSVSKGHASSWLTIIQNMIEKVKHNFRKVQQLSCPSRTHEW